MTVVKRDGQDLVRIRRDPLTLDHLGVRVDRLHDQLGTPVTARRLWLQTWLDCYPDFDPWFVTVERDEELVAFAALGAEQKLGVTHHVPVGHGPSDVVEFSAVDEAAGRALADALASELSRRSDRWTFTGRSFYADSLMIPVLLDCLPWAQRMPGQVHPLTTFDAGRELRPYVTRNYHQQVRRLVNKADRDGLDVHVQEVGGDDLVALIDAMMAIQRLREIDAGRRLKTEHEHDGAFLRKVIVEHARHKLVKATVLSVQGDPAAFTITFLDGSVRRLWTLAFDPQYREYGVGKLCVDESLRHALADPRCEHYDWMKGDEAYKRTFATEIVETVEIGAWSSKALRMPFDLSRRVRSRVKEWAVSDERIQKLVEAGSRARTAWWHRSARSGDSTGNERA